MTTAHKICTTCVFLASLGLLCLAAQPAQAVPVLPEDNMTLSCGSAGKKILIAYDTIHGSTAEVAVRIGDKLCDMGFTVDVKWVGDVTGVDGYDGFIVGSAIYQFSFMPVAIGFLEEYKTQLAAKPTAIFMVGASMSTDTPETREMVQERFIDPVLERIPEVTPVSIGLFGGAVDFTKEKYSLFERIVLRILGLILRYWNKADWRDWDTIDNWAAEVGGQM